MRTVRTVGYYDVFVASLSKSRRDDAAREIVEVQYRGLERGKYVLTPFQLETRFWDKNLLGNSIANGFWGPNGVKQGFFEGHDPTRGGLQNLAGRVESSRVESGRVGSESVRISWVGSGQEGFESLGSIRVGRSKISRVGPDFTLTRPNSTPPDPREVNRPLEKPMFFRGFPVAKKRFCVRTLTELLSTRVGKSAPLFLCRCARFFSFVGAVFFLRCEGCAEKTQFS